MSFISTLRIWNLASNIYLSCFTTSIFRTNLSLVQFRAVSALACVTKVYFLFDRFQPAFEILSVVSYARFWLDLSSDKASSHMYLFGWIYPVMLDQERAGDKVKQRFKKLKVSCEMRISRQM